VTEGLVSERAFGLFFNDIAFQSYLIYLIQQLRLTGETVVENDKANPQIYHVLPGPKMGLITPEYLEQVAA